MKQRDADLVPAVYLELGKLYTKFGLYKEANDSLEKCRSYEENPQVLRYLIFLKIREKNYDDAYFFLRRLLKQPNVDKKDSNLNNLIFFVHHKMGISNENINADSYFCSQVAHYSEDEALGHLLNHYETDKRKSSFNSDISLDQLYYEVQERISNLYPDDMTSADKYYIHLGRIIGKYNGEITSTICVVTVPNTNDIVTMYPIRNNHSLVNRPINKEQCFTK
ncbi:MAG: hypothetical protein J6X02_03840 [Bacilli bacterium]|nr:hypothetical protein [Bacilli bacterium]